MKPTILTFVDHYLPGFKAGGPLRSISNLVEQLGDEFHFQIITRDRDSGDAGAYASVPRDRWEPVGKAEVFYASPKMMTLWGLRRVLFRTPHQVLYLNSLFSPRATLIALTLRRLGLVPCPPLIVAPKGELSPGALAIKRRKKGVYLRLAKLLGLYEGALWQASSPYEVKDIERHFPDAQGRIHVAPDLPGTAALSTASRRKQAGVLRVVFVSRITPKKNLEGALEVLRRLSGEVEFTIVGPVSSNGYWKKCLALIRDLPENIRVEYRGPVDHSLISGVYAAHDLFFLPTRGENYGHVVPEAMLAGCPVLISDQTPWRGLEEEHAGWDVPLVEVDRFLAVLERVREMDDHEHGLWVEGARRFGRQLLANDQSVEQNRRLLIHAVERTRDPDPSIG
jgi:glycosyltransferase involved in cell wall biosynthesis